MQTKITILAPEVPAEILNDTCEALRTSFGNAFSDPKILSGGTFVSPYGVFFNPAWGNKERENFLIENINKIRILRQESVVKEIEIYSNIRRSPFFDRLDAEEKEFINSKLSELYDKKGDIDLEAAQTKFSDIILTPAADRIEFSSYPKGIPHNESAMTSNEIMDCIEIALRKAKFPITPGIIIENRVEAFDFRKGK